MQLIYNLIYRFTPFLPRVVGIEDIYKQDPSKPIFIRNTTQNLDVGAGEVIVYIPYFDNSGHRQNLHLFLPKTELPVNATKQLTRTQFLEASEIRSAIFEGLYELIDARFAKYLLSTKKAKQEILSITTKDDSIKSKYSRRRSAYL